MVDEVWVVSDAPTMLFLFLEKNYAFDWKDNFCS